MTKVMNKKPKRIKEHPSQENQEQDKEFKNQEEFKTQEESLQSRIKIQDSRSQESRSRFKTQDSRIKRRLNQDKY